MTPTLISAVNSFFSFLRILVLARIVISWLMLAMRPNALTNIIYNLTEPLLAPIRNLLNRSPLGGMGMPIDFSVLVLYLIMGVLQNIVIEILTSV